jgi:hypothetical protein
MKILKVVNLFFFDLIYLYIGYVNFHKSIYKESCTGFLFPDCDRYDIRPFAIYLIVFVGIFFINKHELKNTNQNKALSVREGLVNIAFLLINTTLIVALIKL